MRGEATAVRRDKRYQSVMFAHVEQEGGEWFPSIYPKANFLEGENHGRGKSNWQFEFGGSH